MSDFYKAVQEVNDGQLVQELNSAIGDIVQGVNETGKQGKLTLTLTVSRIDSENSVLKVVPDIKAQVPQVMLKAQAMYAHGRQLTLAEINGDEVPTGSSVRLYKL